MKTNIYILFIFTITFIGCKDTTKSIDKEEKRINVADSTLTEPSNSIDSNKLELSDTINVRKTQKQVDTTKNTKVKTGTYEVNLVLNEFEIIDSSFHTLLDSLVKRERRCMNSNLNDLHWTLFEWQEKEYHFTMSSGVGETEYLGFFIINDMLFLTEENLPEQFKKTDKTKKFKFKNKHLPHPEDYSAYFIAKMNGKMTLVKSYPLPCD